LRRSSRWPERRLSRDGRFQPFSGPQRGVCIFQRPSGARRPSERADHERRGGWRAASPQARDRARDGPSRRAAEHPDRHRRYVRADVVAWIQAERRRSA
jgi:hypothetical protein